MIQVVTELGTRALATALSSSAELTFTRCAIGNGEFDPASQDAGMKKQERLHAQA